MSKDLSLSEMPKTASKPRLRWKPIIRHAADIAASYDTLVTLRQLFYRLVSDGSLPNTDMSYKHLSRLTAGARREGWFPELSDGGRSVGRGKTFASPADAITWLGAFYRRDRTEGQRYAIYLAVEKAGLVAQLESWFGDYGVPVFALRGYSSESFERELAEDIADDGRPAVILYAGDFDPSGEDIERNFVEQLEARGCRFRLRRVALTVAQVRTYDLPVNAGKETDARAAAFASKYGGLYQVEVDALAPEDLHALFTSAFEEYWDEDAYEAAMDAEQADAAALETWSGDAGGSTS